MITKPLPGAQINWLHPSARGQVLNLLCNEGAGNQVWDYSLKGNHGILNGPTWASGRNEEWTLNFVASNPDNIIIPKESEIITGTHDWTLAIWVKPTTNPAVACMGLQWQVESGWNDYLLVGVAATMRVAVYHPGEILLVSDVANAIDVGVWQQFVLTRNGDNYALYKNGSEISTGNPAGVDLGSGPPNVDYYIGTSFTEIQAFDGLHGGEIVWQRALSATEVMEQYLCPYCIFEWPEPAKFYVSVVGVPIPSFMRHYRNMRMN